MKQPGLPRYAYFTQTAEMMAEIEGLRESAVELGFLDLAGFKRFNDSYGQHCGDQVLRALAEHLAAIPRVRAVRDGGDEFLIVGAPMFRGLEACLEQMRRTWPTRFRHRFGDGTELVRPRIVFATVRASALIAAREELGRALPRLKAASPQPGPEGVLSRTAF